MSKKICNVKIGLGLSGGLAGGDYEYDPYLAFHTSFGEHRIPGVKKLLKTKTTDATWLQTGSHHSFGENGKQEQSREEKEREKKSAEEAYKEKISNIQVVYDDTAYVTKKQYNFELPVFNEMRGDDSIWFKVFSHTRYSGVLDIDNTDAAFVERVIPSGVCQLQLYDVFSHYLEFQARQSNDNNRLQRQQRQQNVQRQQQQQQRQQQQSPAKQKQLPGKEEFTYYLKDYMYDGKLIEEKTREFLQNNERGKNISNEQFQEMYQTAVALTRKSAVTFQITISEFDQDLYERSIFNVPNLRTDHVHSFISIGAGVEHQRTEYAAILHNSTKCWGSFERTMNHVLESYCHNFVQMNSNGPKPLYSPSEEAVENLQFPMYVSDQGRMPVCAYWSHDPYYREYSSAQAREQALTRYGFDQNSEDLLSLMLRSALRRYGLSEKVFIEAIEKHHSLENKATVPEDNFLLAEEALMDAGTFAANSAYYTADFRWTPKQANYQEAQRGLRKQTALRNCGSHDHSDSHQMNVQATNTTTTATVTTTMMMINIDDWARPLANNLSHCDDCEGQDNAATNVLRTYGIGRHDLGFNWKSRLMRAAKLMLDHMVCMDVGALVSSAYVDTNNAKIDLKNTDLPMIGDAIDKRSVNDGHCFAIAEAQSRVIAKVARGNVDTRLLEKMRAYSPLLSDKAFLARDTARPPLTLEATGSIEARILPIRESYASSETLMRKKEAERLFMKNQRQILETLKKSSQNKASDFSDLFCFESPAFYVETQDPRRKVHPFYHSVVHGTSAELMKRFGITLSQFAFCRTSTSSTCYGVRMNELLRDTALDKNAQISLVFPYINDEEEWRRSVVPMMETHQNQQAVAAFARYSEKSRARILSHYVSPSLVTHQTNFEARPPVIDASAQQFERLLASVAETPNLSVARLYSRSWKLNQSKEKTEAFKQFLASAEGLVSHGFYVERHFPVCDPIVEILCVIDVNVCMSLKNKPKTQ